VSARGGTKYGPEYVTALKKQVPGLVCLGDDRPFRLDLPYWWCLMEWFAPWNQELRPCLWLDLDTYVFDLDPFYDLDTTKFWMIRDFNTPTRPECGVMLLPKDTDRIWEAFSRLKYGNRAPVGPFLEDFCKHYLQDAVSGIYSYKNHAKTEKPPDSRIICFHGQPKPPETTGWAKQWWTMQR